MSDFSDKMLKFNRLVNESSADDINDSILSIFSSLESIFCSIDNRLSKLESILTDEM